MSPRTSPEAMADEDGQTQAQRVQNLARIRDNQRRSRARRKEYLQELETKFRVCEQTGVEASAEIQAAARRVADENRRLRQLLRQQGMSDAEIDGMLGEDMGPVDPQHMTAANELESLLGVKKLCCPGSKCSPSDASRRSQSCTPAPREQHISIQPAPSTSVRPPRLHVTPQQRITMPQYASPLSATSATIPTPNTATGVAPRPHSSQPYIMPTSANQQHTFDYVMPVEDLYSGWQQTEFYPNPPIVDSSSCYVAADVIRTIKPDVGYELEEQLGCGDGRECNVPNSQIFGLMDHYSAGVP